MATWLGVFVNIQSTKFKLNCSRNCPFNWFALKVYRLDMASFGIDPNRDMMALCTSASTSCHNGQIMCRKNEFLKSFPARRVMLIDSIVSVDYVNSIGRHSLAPTWVFGFAGKAFALSGHFACLNCTSNANLICQVLHVCLDQTAATSQYKSKFVPSWVAQHNGQFGAIEWQRQTEGTHSGNIINLNLSTGQIGGLSCKEATAGEWDKTMHMYMHTSFLPISTAPN